MVALLDKSPLPSKTALRARGAASRPQSRRATAVKSCSRIELRRFSYDACRRLGSCSNELVGSGYGYVSNRSTIRIDPLGLKEWIVGPEAAVVSFIAKFKPTDAMFWEFYDESALLGNQLQIGDYAIFMKLLDELARSGNPAPCQ